MVATKNPLSGTEACAAKIGQMPHGLAAVATGEGRLFRSNLRLRGRTFGHFLMPAIPQIQPRQMIDFIGSSEPVALPTVDLGQPSQDGKS